jgi:hypothetical protein
MKSGQYAGQFLMSVIYANASLTGTGKV